LSEKVSICWLSRTPSVYRVFCSSVVGSAAFAVLAASALQAEKVKTQRMAAMTVSFCIGRGA
jgi:hypothetical protein